MSSLGQDPNPHWNSLKRYPNRPEEVLTAGLPSDPLLKSGSFIEATASGRQGTAETPRMRRSSDGASPSMASEKSNGAETPLPENTASPAGAQQRRVAAAPLPDWLPPGWLVEDRVRSSGASAGVIDRYFFEPVSGRRFRSKNEVLYFLETGTKRKKGKLGENSDADTMGSEGQKEKKSATKAKSSALKFDYLNVPEKVQWVLTDSSQGSWAPYIGEEKVPESTMQEWAAAFTAATSKHYGKRKV
ncbi:methyl-CpG-binding domain-containing protein 5-like [Juglans regia]|uniref:Methyl-CpG-binding domain-containing protein 5-like n=2 Tax=Juglans regia TaxID=51240 RepID=A0A2I4E7N3_JUGRE|nr:methyl-CpG-binding domain-containing protein 5-like [Juglans regia]